MFVSRNPATGETWAELPAWDDSRLEPALARGQERQCLHGFAQTHIVRQDPSEAPCCMGR